MHRQDHVAIRIRRPIVFGILAAIALGMLLVLLPGRAYAATNEGPNPESLGGRPGDQFGYILTQGFSAAEVPTTTVPIYFTTGFGPKRILIYDGNLCTDRQESAPAAGGNQKDQSNGNNITGDPAAQFYVQNTVTGENFGTVYSQVSDANDCYAQSLTLTFEADQALTEDPRTGLYQAFFQARVMPTVDNAQNRYRIVVEEPTAIVGFSSQNASNSFGVGRMYPYSGYNDYRLPFGPDCDLVGDTPAQAVLYDLDNGSSEVQNGTMMQTYIDEISPSGSITKLNLRFTTNRDPSSPQIAGVTGDRNGYILPELNRQFAYAQFTAKSDHRYVFGLRQVYYKNILQFQLPFDSILFDRTRCTPPPPPPPPPPVFYPYFQVTGGDVAAGSSIETAVGRPCNSGSPAAPNPRGGIVSWNRGGTPDFAGAGAQYGAFAMDFIQDLVTGQGNGRVAPGQETNQLTFANTSYSGSVNIGQGLFGGMFESAPCIDYWSGRPSLTKAPPNDTPSTWPSGVYYVTGRMTLQPGVIPAGRHITLYVENDVAIVNPGTTFTGITYAPGPYANRLNIPSFKLIVNGTIYIGSTVSNLDGLYAAIPDPGGTTQPNQFTSPIPGTISTCSNGFNSYNPMQAPSGSIYTPCNRRLTVTGSVAANQVWLLRTFGTLGGGQAAEVFTYSPEIWLAPAGSGGANVPDYQSVVGLPPIL